MIPSSMFLQAGLLPVRGICLLAGQQHGPAQAEQLCETVHVHGFATLLMLLWLLAKHRGQI